MELPILKFISEDKDGHQIYEVTYDDGSKGTLHGKEYIKRRWEKILQEHSK